VPLCDNMIDQAVDCRDEEVPSGFDGTPFETMML